MTTAATIDSSNAPGGPVSWVLTDAAVGNLCDTIVMCQRVVIDLETTGLDEYATTGGARNGGVAARVALASLTLPMPDAQGEWDGREPTTFVVPLSHPSGPHRGTWRAVLRRICQTVLDAHRPVENQNVTFDARWMYAVTGVDLSELIVWDPMLAASLTQGPERTSRKLKQMAPRIFGIPAWNDIDLSTPGAAEQADLYRLGDYAARDTYWTWRLGVHQQRELYLDRSEGVAEPDGAEEIRLARFGRLMIWETLPTCRSLTRIECNGFRLDAEWCRDRLSEREKQLDEALGTLSRDYGMERSAASVAAASKWFIELTERAIAAAQLEVTAVTPSGRPQWNKAVLNAQAGSSTTAERILTARHCEKQAQFLRSWLQYQNAAGRIHAHYNLGSVATGRLSSDSPNMQQVTKELRPAFIPEPGYYVADFDFSQIEMRVAAFIARAHSMIQAFRRGDDLHRLFAARMTGKAPADVTPEERQKAKAGNFGLLFGMGHIGFQTYAAENYGVVMDLDEAKRVYGVFFRMWPELREWHARAVAGVNRLGYVVNPLGRVRHLPEVWDANESRAQFAERAAINTPVQGMASSLMQMAAASVQGFLPGTEAVPRVKVVGTVHDSLVALVPRDGWRETVAAVRGRMEGIGAALKRLDVDFNVPLVADATVGTRWSLNDAE